MKAIFYYLKKPVSESVGVYWELIKIMIPVMVLVRLGQEFGVIELVSHVFTPFMSIMGLPAEAGLIWTTAMLVNIYGGIAVLISLIGDHSFTTAQMTIIGMLMLLAHGLPVEQRVVQKSGPGLIFTTLLRIGGALVCGVLLHLLFSTFDLLTDPVRIEWLPEINSAASWTDWALNSAHSLFMIYWIILGLMILLQVLESIGVTKIIAKTLSPVLGRLGISDNATPVTMIGVLLGLSFGGALIMREARNGTMTPRDIFLSLSFLCLCHSIIEDTLLILAIGADLTTILVGRFVFSFIVIFGLARLLPHIPDHIFLKFFFTKQTADAAVKES